MSSAFRTAVRSNVQREERLAAIDRLAEEGDTSNLRLLVQMDGMNGGLRRHALDRLDGTGGTTELERLAEDHTLPASLRDEVAHRLR